MKKYLPIAVALLLAASISACGTAKGASSAAAEAQNVENAAELTEKTSENAAELTEKSAENAANLAEKAAENAKEEKKDPAAPENTAANEKAAADESPSLPENTAAEEEKNAAPEIAADGQLPEEDISNEPYGYAIEENPDAENIPYIDEDAPAVEIPEEALDDFGAEVPINEDYGYSFDEEVSTPAEVAGTYTLYAWDEHGKILKPDAKNYVSTITLEEDGTGTLMVNEETTVIDRWGTSGTMFAMFYDEHGAADGTLDEGVIILDPLDGDDILYFYAKEGVDLTKVLSTEREKYILED